MTVALSDVVLLAPMIAAEPDLTDWHALTDVLHRWHWARKPLASTINIMSVALYDLFSADGKYTCPLTVASPLRLPRTSDALIPYVRTQASALVICGPDVSSTLNAAGNAFEVRSRCSRGESLSSPRRVTTVDNVFTRTYEKILVLHQIRSYSLTISSPWQSTLSGFYSSIRGTSAFPGARNPSLHGPRWQSTLYCGSLPSGQ